MQKVGECMKLKVLVVDDEPDIVVLLRKYLREAGYDTEAAFDGFDAFQKIQAWHPDLVVSDVQMPVWDGFKLLKSLQELHEEHRTPVLIISGYVGGNELELTRSPNFVGFLAKPFNARKIVESVNSYFNH